MNRVIALSFLVFCILTMQAQGIIIDKGLTAFVDAVVLLRQSNTTNEKKTKAELTKDKKWTLMDELKDANNNECWLTKKMKRFNLVPILTEVLTERYGKNLSRGDFLNGEDPRFDSPHGRG